MGVMTDYQIEAWQQRAGLDADAVRRRRDPEVREKLS